MTNPFYCYVYYDDLWQAYYVGKGQGQRFYTKDNMSVPERDHIQRFFFSKEWQAWECEIELIAFWMRQCDGGTLLNQSTGGPGCPGVIPSEETRKKRSEKLKGRVFTPEWRQKISDAQQGEKNWWRGRKHNPETKAKMSAARSKYWENKRNAQ